MRNRPMPTTLSDCFVFLFLNVYNGFEVAVRILQVDKMILTGRPGGSLGAFQWLEDLPEVLVVSERRVDGDWRMQHCSSDEYFNVGAPDALVVNVAIVDVVWLSDGSILAAAVTPQLVNNQLPHLSQRPSSTTPALKPSVQSSKSI